MTDEIQIEEVKNLETEELTLTVVEDKRIKDGLHEGQIVDVTKRTFDFKGKELEYIDFKISIEDEFHVKFSVNSRLSMSSQLGGLILDFGGSLQVDEKVSLKAIFLGKPCTIMTMTGNNGYANAVKGSMKFRQ